MTEKQYLLVKCYNEMWGINDRKQSELDNPVLIAYSKAGVGFIVNQLNNKNERIKELETRNKRQYERLKEITDLMQNRDWESLEKMVEDWEQAEEQLEREWGIYGDVE